MSDNDFKYLIQELGSKNLELLKQKDAYCYEYMHSFKRFNEEKLPDKKCFCSSIKDGTIGGNGKKLDGHISDESYLKWKKIGKNLTWKTWVIMTIIIFKKDVLLLADVIDTCLEFYKLDPCHYFSSPGLSWDAMLKMTGVKLEKIFDIEMYLFTEKGWRGEICYIAKRYSEANNKHMKIHYDPTKYISYLDMNNLYGWVMSSYLSYGGFNSLKNVDNFDINSVSKKSPVGYISEVDVEWIACITQWLSISSRKTCSSLWHAVRFL